MASGMTNEGLKRVLENTIDLENDTLKVMLVDDTFVFDPDVYVVDKDDDGVNDAHHHEINPLVGYIGGFGGSGRKVASITVDINTMFDRAEVVVEDITWTEIGILGTEFSGMALLIKEVTSDLDSIIIAAWDILDVPCVGGDITLDFAASGNIRIS